MRTKKYIQDNESAGFNLSISDLMAALCALLALVMIVFAFQLKKSEEGLQRLTNEYQQMQKELYEELCIEFDKDLKKWDAEITEDLTIRFKNEKVMFKPESAELKPDFENILSDFFPRLTSILNLTKFKDEIEEIRIEGHTATNDNMSRDNDYITGMRLSQMRTTNVMLYCLNTIPTRQYREWTQRNIAAIGYSNSRPISADGVISKEKSRRVEFRIKTKADAKIREIAEELKGDA
ncbi:MAG: OmpA family protein [Spirochaetia bacterium]|nr:OmpA family protein [Spirochaetia bacterium]